MALAACTLPVDARRGVAAVWHLQRCLQVHRALLGARAAGRPRSSMLYLERQVVEHLRIARGYLGAVGFEAGGRLEF